MKIKNLGMEDAETTAKPPKKKEAEPEMAFGLSIDFNECVDEFCEPAKVLPFVRPAKRE